MSDALTSQDGPPPQFAYVRRGYDPGAVDDFVARAMAEQQAVSSSEAEVRAKANDIVRDAQRRAAQVLQEADDALASASDQRARAENLALESERQSTERVEAAMSAAEELISQARGQADAILAEVERVEADAQVTRWADVGDRVTRILGAAETESAGIVADATAASDRLQVDSRSEAERLRLEADHYAEETRALADEWATARVAAADADQVKASEALDNARTRAARILADAEAEAHVVHDRATTEVTEHIQDLLARARYDLDQLETRADAARAQLAGLRDLADRSLEAGAGRPSAHLGVAGAFLGRAGRRDDADGALGGDEPSFEVLDFSNDPEHRDDRAHEG